MKTTQKPGAKTKSTAGSPGDANKPRSGSTKQSSATMSPAGEEASGLRELFQDSLKDIYWAEKALTKALPKMIQKATSADLIDALTQHLRVTEQQVTRLEEVFNTLGLKAQAKKCAAMEGLIQEGSEIMESTTSGVVRDAGIIAAGQKVEHYEIASYGTLCAFAKILGETEVAELLMETLNEEKEADDKLSEVAEGSINLQAAGQDAVNANYREE